MKSAKKGFTLIELMIVISIIGVLVGLLTPMISNAQKNAVKATSKTFFSNMVNALERYKDEYGYFPDFLSESGTFRERHKNRLKATGTR